MPASEPLQDFFAALRPRVAGDLRTDAMSRALYATDASLYQIEPVGVLIPRHEDDVQAALEEAARHGVPVLPRGAGSSLAGQTVGAALVIDFTKHLDAILEVNPEERWARVQAGCVLDRLNAAAAPHGLMIGPDPAPSNRATLGGMVGNNSTGTHSILYGNFIRHVRGADVFLDDGTPLTLGLLGADAWAERIRRSGREGDLYGEIDALLAARGDVVRRDTPTHWRRNSGYRLEAMLEDGPRSLAQLLCGSEGTLAVTRTVELSLVDRPTRTGLGVVHFHTRRDALRAVTALLETGPSAVELFDGTTIDQCRRSPGFASRLTFVEGEPGGLLLTEYYGESQEDLLDKLDRLDAVATGLEGCYGIVRSLSPERIADVWSVRKEALGLVMSVKGDVKPLPFIEDASVPVEHLPDYIDALTEVFETTQTPAVMYAHASAGCLHIRPFLNLKQAADVVKMRDIAQGSMELVRRFGGAVSSEHGDGLARSWLNEPLLGRELVDAYRQLKRVFDPRGVLNPGKVVDAPPMTESLRIGPTYATIPVMEELDWTEDGGFARAVELCNGNGACRKLESGTMCPSFMATREEAHSTRGRANALRAAMSGALPPEAFTGPEVYEVMDLCIQCKGCKTECPSNVDMAKIKTEWLNTYWKANRMPLRTRLFARMPEISPRVAGPLAPLVNRVNALPPVRWLLDRTLGISRERRMPPFAREPFTKARRAAGAEADDGRPAVVLFADTFNNYHHPDVAHAAATFLERVGYRVIVPEQRVCCGRTYLSKGMITEAQRHALATIDALYPLVEQGRPVVGLEPSCILTLTDEFLTLVPGDPRARAVAEAAHTFGAFVAREADAGRLDHVQWTEVRRRVLLHGHCHQKALVGTAPSFRCLSLPPGYQVETLDTSCCGMAGAFGYEKEHVAVSKQMAERRLAPAVRAAEPGTLVAAAGTSCRAQIEDVAGRTALHPAQILLDALHTAPGASGDGADQPVHAASGDGLPATR